MDEYRSLSHSTWECKYHVVFIPKCRRKTLYGQLRQYLGEVFRRLAEQKGSRIEEGHLMPDHVHMMISIPPKYAVSEFMGYLKGKLALRLFNQYEHLGKRYWGRHLWAHGYCVSTIGLDEERIRKYVQWREQREKREANNQHRLFD